jgi:HEAT repeat protein
VRALLGLLEDEGSFVRWSAAEALGRLGPLGPEQAAGVRALLSHADPDVRYNAATVLAAQEAAG